MEDMHYYASRLQCSDAEKDACLQTVAKLYRLRRECLRNGHLHAATLAESEPDPFFRVALQEFAELAWDPDGLDQLLSRYLLAEDYHGGAFLNAVLIWRGLVLLARRFTAGNYHADADCCLRKDWDDALSEALRGYFGIAYRDRVQAAIWQAVHEDPPAHDAPSLVPEFDRLTELPPDQRDRLVRQFSSRTLCLALKCASAAASDFLIGGAADPEQLRRDLSQTYNVRQADVEAAQRQILDAAKEVAACGS